MDSRIVDLRDGFRRARDRLSGSGSRASPPGLQRVEVEEFDGAVSDRLFGGRAIAIDHDCSTHDQARAFISDAEDRVFGTNPFVLSEVDLPWIFIGLHRFDVDFDGGAVRRGRFEVGHQVRDPAKIESCSIPVDDLCPRRRLVSDDHSADGALRSDDRVWSIVWRAVRLVLAR